MEIEFGEMMNLKGHGFGDPDRAHGGEKTDDEIGNDQFGDQGPGEGHFAPEELDTPDEHGEEDSNIFEAQADDVALEEIGEGQLGVGRDKDNEKTGDQQQDIGVEPRPEFFHVCSKYFW